MANLKVACCYRFAQQTEKASRIITIYALETKLSNLSISFSFYSHLKDLFQELMLEVLVIIGIRNF
jgi:uncharacterized protein (DUF486 family)